jgi:hypothetical protein
MADFDSLKAHTLASLFKRLSIFRPKPIHPGRIEFWGVLANRPVFDSRLWETINVPQDFLECLLRLFMHQLRWPNFYFVPDDRLIECLIPEYDEPAWAWVFADINRNFGTDLKLDDFIRFKRLNTKIGDFVLEVREKHTARPKLLGTKI